MGFDWEFMLGDDGDLADLYDEHIVDDYDDYHGERIYPQDFYSDEDDFEEYEDDYEIASEEDPEEDPQESEEPLDCEYNAGQKNTNEKGENKMYNAIKISDLKNHSGDFILVKGKVTYSRIGKLIQGEELKVQNQRNIQHGMPQYHYAYTTMTITEAEVQVADADNLTLPEQWAMTRLYKSRSSRATKDAMNFRATCLSSILPGVLKTVVRDGKTFLIGENANGREIASGTEVTLVLQVYESKGKMDVALQNVVVATDEIPWYTNSLQRLAEVLHVDGVIPAASERVGGYTEETDNSRVDRENFEVVYDESELPF